MSEAAMKKPMSMSMPILPVELTVEILVRVPVKPLLRFKCLSKQFCALIESPFFVKKHLKHSSTNQKLVVSSIFQTRLYSAHIETDIDNTKLAVARLKLPTKTKSRSIEVLASCNGLLCLKISGQQKERIIFWNPTIKKQWKSRSHVIPTPPCSPTTDATCVSTAYGFGYASQSNDYKMVYIQQIFKPNFTSVKVWGTDIHVYSMQSNKWRIIDGFPHGNILLSSDKCGVLVNECLYWLIIEPLPGHRDNLIVVFEIGSESFRMISLPTVRAVGTSVSIHVLGGFLCAYYQCEDGFDVWVMKNSWTMLFTIDRVNFRGVPSFYRWFPVAYSRDEDKVLLHNTYDISGMIISYDLVNKRIEVVDTQGMPRHFWVMAYSESLVNPNDKCLHAGRRSSWKTKASKSKRGSIVFETDA